MPHVENVQTQDECTEDEVGSKAETTDPPRENVPEVTPPEIVPLSQSEIAGGCTSCEAAGSGDANLVVTVDRLPSSFDEKTVTTMPKSLQRAT